MKIMQMKTMCVGRFLIDVPENAIVSYRGASLSGWDISSWIEADEEFFARLAEEEAKHKTGKNERGHVSLEQVREIKNQNVQARIFVYDRMWLEMFPGGVRKESQVVAIRAFARSHDVTYSFYSKIRYDTDVQELERIIGQLRWRKKDEIPMQSGFCLENAFLTEPLAPDDSEYTSMFVGLKEHPDLAIALSTLAGVAPQTPYLQRDAENTVKNEYRSRFHTLREGPRTLAGVPGGEVMDRVDEPNGSVLHDFMWESLNTTDNVYRPLLTLELSTGHGQPGRPVNSSLSDVEVLALWEKTSASLRVRPISESGTTASSKNQ
ncbi:T6SS immunity protein Tli4 family protein [Duganella sp. P38]|uniref:T6SS immunity protein Tli4 family protein n=1 Tax=Duganella sp. P38 TaxID=3423949 RepID=UPI003D79037B